MTGLSNRVSTGDSFPSFNITCNDQSQSCSQGRYDRQAMQRIIFGPDADGVCAATSRARRGMCDVFIDINFFFLDMIGLDGLVYLPPIEATLMGEDLRNG